MSNTIPYCIFRIVVNIEFLSTSDAQGSSRLGARLPLSTHHAYLLTIVFWFSVWCIAWFVFWFMVPLVCVSFTRKPGSSGPRACMGTQALDKIFDFGIPNRRNVQSLTELVWISVINWGRNTRFVFWCWRSSRGRSCFSWRECCVGVLDDGEDPKCPSYSLNRDLEQGQSTYATSWEHQSCIEIWRGASRNETRPTKIFLILSQAMILNTKIL